MYFSVSLIICLGIRYPVKYDDIIKRECAKNSLDPALVAAIIATESGYNERAISSKGAVGLMQIMPDTAKYVCKIFGEQYVESDLFVPGYNIGIGCKYLRYLGGKFSEVDILIAYNAGEGNAKKWINNGLDVPFKETRDYISRVYRVEKYYRVKYRILQSTMQV